MMGKKNNIGSIDQAALLAKMSGTTLPSAAVTPPPVAAPIPPPAAVEQEPELPEQQAEEVAAKGDAAAKTEKAAPAVPPPVKYRKGSYEDLFLNKNIKGANKEKGLMILT